MKLIIVVIAMMVTLSLLAGYAETPEKLAGQFIKAVNEKSKEKQIALIHPQCFANLNPVQQQFLDEALAKDFRKTIPEKRTVNVRELPGPELPFAGIMEWPVKATHLFVIDFSTGKHASTSMMRFIVKDKKQWFIVVPMLNADNLKKYNARKNLQNQRRLIR